MYWATSYTLSIFGCFFKNCPFDIKTYNLYDNVNVTFQWTFPKIIPWTYPKKKKKRYNGEK